ncbi:MAG TPA: hypothetical protein PKE65_04495 [Rhizobiaceae bacterium]|nr:hypothetical protein [Rhizobiaceae bacterium]
MGAWGAGLYQSDAAADLKDEFRRFSRLPLGGAELAAMISQRHPESGDPADEEYSTFWLVLADLFHRHGIEDAQTFDRARAIIADGSDDRVLAELEMSDRDREKRRTALQALAAKWAIPDPKPAKRKILKTPEPFAVEEGDIWIFPTQDGNPPNTYFPEAEIAKRFKPDGWAAFAIVANRHQLGYFAATFFLRLHVDAPEPPELDTCRSAAISGVKYYIMQKGQPLAHAAGWAEITKPVLKKMRAQKVGSVVFDKGKVALRIHGFELDERREPGSLCGLLHCWQRFLGTEEWMDLAAPLDIRMPDLIVTGEGAA